MLHNGRALASCCFLFLWLAAAVAGAEVREGVGNGSFEGALHHDGSRPRWWVVGFVGEPPGAEGGWSIADDAVDGRQSLELSCETAGDSFFVSQVLDLPGGTMEGVTVALELSARRLSDEGEAVIILFALNPEAPVDPDFGVPLAGKLVLLSTDREWERLQMSLELDYPAEELALVLAASGAGARVRFDDVSVTADLPLPGCGPAPLDVPLLDQGRPPFPLGIVNENPRNGSEAALEGLAREAADMADVVNVFAHVRWNALTGRPLLDGHERVLTVAEGLQRYGVPRMLTFDFTHDSPNTVGDLNPLPDGTPVGRLDDPGISDAYLEELEALVEAIHPTWVSVGIETDFFWERHGDQWPAFRALLCEAQSCLSDLHVTTYFTLPTLVYLDGSANHIGQAAMRELLGCIDSVGYSTYASDGVIHLEDLPPGYFTAASAVAPELPLILPEFGFRGGDGPYPEEEQEAMLRRAVAELRERPVAAACWYSLYDQDYFGTPAWFQTWFRTIGLRHLDGTPKRAWVLLHRTHQHGRHRRPVELPAADEPCVQTRTSHPGSLQGEGSPQAR